MKKQLPISIVGLVAALFVVGTSIAVTQQPEAVIELVTWSPQEIHDAHLDQPISSGLSVVGAGEVVYLRGVDAEGEDVTSYAWSIISAPAGSVAAVDSADMELASFIPDMVGKYEVELTVTTASGMSTTTQVITAAEYVGIGSIAGGTPDFAAGQCAGCHSDKDADWSKTGHSDMFTLAIDGLKSDHYNSDCISCHTLGFRTDAVNGGFDDVATDLGWTFPDTLVDGNWQDIVDNYPQLAQLSNIQCENCHGPGSMHKGNKEGIAISLESGACASCHEEEPYHVRPTQWKNSAHATGSSFSRGGSSSCAPCHSGWGFVARMDPASNLEKTSGIQNVSCATCHDPHNTKYEHQLRSTEDVTLVDGTVITNGDTGKLCMQCHQARREAEAYVDSNPSTFRGGHGSIQSDVLYGTNAFEFGRTLPNSTHKDVAKQACVTCHMAGPARGEPGHFELGDHSWAMNADLIDGTDTTSTDNVAACLDCHDPTMTSFDDIMAREDYDGDGEIESAQEEVHGLLHNVALLIPPLGEDAVDGRDTTMTVLQKKGLWNYFYAEEDGSFGVHNYQYTVALLQLTEEALTFGVLDASSITSIADVPNDQGKQVEVQWGRFGGDGVSDEPVQMYHVWRMSEVAAAKEKPTYASLKGVPATTVTSDASVLFNGEVWTAVASQPAASMDMYSAIAPTLADSTADGVPYSFFMVSGHTSDTQVYVVTAPDSGYSVDNLAPLAPSNVAVSLGSFGVVLTWDDPYDADFNYFSVYRSTEPGFEIETGELMRSVTGPTYSDVNVDIGATYYYKVVATDFSGNVSVPSVEVSSGLVTNVEATGGIPEVFALHPNYPNPFNPSTIVTYDVPASSEVSVVLYDVVGRALDILVDGTVAAGSHTVTVEAGHLPSGLYFVRMVTPDGIFERTITLLR